MGRAGGEDGVWITRGLLQNEDKVALLVLLTLTRPAIIRPPAQTTRLDPRMP